jgi:acetyl esterase/lipase
MAHPTHNAPTPLTINCRALLAEAGVPAESRRFDGLIHTTLTMSGAVPMAAEIQDAMADFLTPLFSSDA